jgi:UDP-N-acetylmuramate--alanine ligase
MTQYWSLRHVHFVGIGGAGMSAIAEVLRKYDVELSGCDLQPSETTRHLGSLGIPVHYGHDAGHLEGVDLVVRSSAVADSNPEIAAARERGTTVIRRASMLAELVRLNYGIAIAGTHGKTTTTSLVGTLLTAAGKDPTVIVGGRLRLSGTGARLGESDYLVVEADEFDRSFLRLMPVVAVVTSIDNDHLDTYRDLAEIQEAFVSFADRVPFFGRAIVCQDDANIREILKRLSEVRVATYGLSPQSDLMATEVDAGPAGTRFAVRRRSGETLGAIEIPMPGLHNVRNALAAVLVGSELGVDFGVMAEALRTFRGVHRRFERLGTWRGAAVVDDYAHHPTEVRATLAAARQAFPGARLFAVFQPHLYSRTRDLHRQFGQALQEADVALVTEVYASREAPIEGVSGELVVEAAQELGHRQVRFCPDWRDAAGLLAAEVRAGDAVITLGAGDIYRLGQRLAEEGA